MLKAASPGPYSQWPNVQVAPAAAVGQRQCLRSSVIFHSNFPVVKDTLSPPSHQTFFSLSCLKTFPQVTGSFSRHLCRGVLICITIWKSSSWATWLLEAVIANRITLSNSVRGTAWQLLPPQAWPPLPRIQASAGDSVVFLGGKMSVFLKETW